MGLGVWGWGGGAWMEGGGNTFSVLLDSDHHQFTIIIIQKAFMNTSRGQGLGLKQSKCK